MFNSKSFLIEMIGYYLPICVGICSKKDARNESKRKRNLYKHGIGRYYDELDAINVLKTLRRSKIVH